MTAAERFRSCLAFKKIDRLPMVEWATWWDKTIRNWKSQGLVIEAFSPFEEGEALQRQFGLDIHMQFWIDPKGRETPKPSGHGKPVVTSMSDYERILPSLYPSRPFDEKRLQNAAKLHREGEIILWVTMEGPFWFPRSLLGIEPHLFAFYDEPELMQRMNGDLVSFNLRSLDELCQYAVPDFITIAEDMSYNLGSMISKDLFDAFLLPHYKTLLPAIRDKGPQVFIDSDGDVSQLIPWFEEAGAQGVLPLERQAGVDIAALRDKHPGFLFIGGFDKTCMHKGEAAMRIEFERLLPVMKKGGFIPSVDHQTPPETSLENYLIYLELLKEYTHKGAST